MFRSRPMNQNGVVLERASRWWLTASLGEKDFLPSKDLIVWIDGFEMLTTSWAVAGCYDVTYKSPTGADITCKYAHLSDVDRYRREFTLEAAVMRIEYTELSTFLYLNAVEEGIRGYACELAKPPKKLPMGVALLRAVEEKTSMWKKKDFLLVKRQHNPNKGHGRGQGQQFQLQDVPPPPPFHATPQENGKHGGGKPPKKAGDPSRASKTKDGKAVCFKWNEGNCTMNNCKFVHGCSKRLASGHACGQNHIASRHDPSKHGAVAKN